MNSPKSGDSMRGWGCRRGPKSSFSTGRTPSTESAHSSSYAGICSGPPRRKNDDLGEYASRVRVLFQINQTSGSMFCHLWIPLSGMYAVDRKVSLQIEVLNAPIVNCGGQSGSASSKLDLPHPPLARVRNQHDLYHGSAGWELVHRPHATAFWPHAHVDFFRLARKFVSQRRYHEREPSSKK